MLEINKFKRRGFLIRGIPKKINIKKYEYSNPMFPPILLKNRPYGKKEAAYKHDIRNKPNIAL